MDIPRMGLPDHLATRLSMAEQHDLLRRAARQNAGRQSRAGLSRRGVLGGGMAAALGAVLPLPGSESASVHGRHVVPFGRHLAWGRNPRSQMRIGWQVPFGVRKPYVRVGNSPQDLGHKIPAEVRALHSEVPGAIAPVNQYYVHADIDHLLPGTRYYYTVGHHGSSTAGRVDAFTTAPTRRRVARPFTFTAFGDQGVGRHALGNDGAVAAQRPAFHLHAGDICYAESSGHGSPVNDDGRHGRDIFHPRTWDRFLDQTESVAASVPWMVAFGNHDMEALYSPDGYGGQLARFEFPDNGPRRAHGVYSFVYGNVGVIALDTNDVTHEIAANRGYTGGTQTTWLAKRLKHLRAQPDVDFVVVFFHHCAYSTAANHASEGGVRSHWVPLFDKYDVDLVINGHNHVYERADVLRRGVPRPTPIGARVYPAVDGTIYVTAGAGGRGLYHFRTPDSYAGHVNNRDAVPSYVWAAGRHRVHEMATWSRVRYTGYSFVAVDAKPAEPGLETTLTLRAVTQHGKEIDRVVIVRRAGGAQRAQLDDTEA
jgi:hypothetical protein